MRCGTLPFLFENSGLVPLSLGILRKTEMVYVIIFVPPKMESLFYARERPHGAQYLQIYMKRESDREKESGLYFSFYVNPRGNTSDIIAATTFATYYKI